MFSPGYLAILVIFMIMSFVVSRTLKSKFKKYSETPLSSGLSGKEIAERMLTDHGITDVKVLSVEGKLTDHYNPKDKTVNLSEAVYHGKNAAAAAVASHECGHAVQHETAYSWLTLRSNLVPIQAASSKIFNVILFVCFIGGQFLFETFPITLVGIIVVGTYAVLTLFSFVTLPVEFDASNRALAWIDKHNVVTTSEYDMSKDALKWAARTYVVAAISSLVMLLYFAFSFFGRD